jgi:hypothetical protein
MYVPFTTQQSEQGTSGRVRRVASNLAPNSRRYNSLLHLCMARPHCIIKILLDDELNIHLDNPAAFFLLFQPSLLSRRPFHVSNSLHLTPPTAQASSCLQLLASFSHTNQPPLLLHFSSPTYHPPIPPSTRLLPPSSYFFSSVLDLSSHYCLCYFAHI